MPALLDLEAVQDTDRVITVYRLRGHWGTIAKSNFSGLPPIARRGAPWGIADTELRRKAEPGSAVSSTGGWL